MRVRVGRALVRHGLAGMAVRMNMHRAVVVAVCMKMHAVAPQPPQQMRAEAHQHDADRGLEWPGDLFRDRVAEQDRSTSEDQQRQRMTKSPGQAMLDDVADLGAACGDRGDRRDVIGLQCVLHAQQEAQTENCEHAPLLFLNQH